MRIPLRPALLSLAVAAGCHTAAGVHGRAGPSGLEDGNIVAIVLAANNTDLSYARLVPGRASSAEVMAFAARMTTDHTLLNARAVDIALRNGIKAEDDATSLAFRERSAARRDLLRELTGSRFDFTYTENEIQYHTELLTVLDGALIPGSRSAELKQFVVALRPAVKAHLAHAEQVRGTLAARK
ncbi:hypothetical protein BH11GEM1_BH11GEM1_18870 [soil metagenome]